MLKTLRVTSRCTVDACTQGASQYPQPLSLSGENQILPNLSLPHFRLISPRPRRLSRSCRTVGPIFLCLTPLLQPLTLAQLAHVAAIVSSASHEPYTRQFAFTFPTIYFCRISIPLTYPINSIMAFKSYPLPSITTGLPNIPPVPVTTSSTAESSPITPLSELSGSSNLTPSSCSASARNYVTYPTGVAPPRQLTPPPTSRFVPLFKSYSKPDNLEETPSSVPVSRGHRSASAILDKSFNPTISRPTPSPLTLAPASVHVEQPPKSAPMRTSHPAPWHTPSQAAEHIEKLNDIISGLRHQLTLKSFDLETSQAELTRISDAYAILVREKAKITDKYIRVKQRLDELEVQVQADERCIARQVKERADFAYRQARLSQEQDELRQWSEFQSGRYDVREKALQSWEERLRNSEPVFRPAATEAGNQSAPVSEDTKVPGEPVPESIVEAVLTRIPPQPTAAEIDDSFKNDGFDFAIWVKECGLKLPDSILVLTPLTWEERVRVNDVTLEALGVLDAKDRSYILQVLYSVARGEVSCLWCPSSPSLTPS